MAQKLAIYNDLPKIGQMVKENQVVWVNVDTGCGKSVGIMWQLLKTGKRIVCTQPTIPAVISLYEYQKKLSPNYKVSYACEGEKKYDNRTQGIYATAGHVRKVMEKYFKDGKASDITFTDVLFVDEIHSGDKNNSIILDLWCETKRQGVKVPNLVLATATMFGTENLQARLGGVFFKSTFRHYDVKVKYHNKDYSIDDDHIYGDAARAAIDLLRQTKSHGIVFVSGSEEVEEMVSQIEEILKYSSNVGMKLPVRVIPCYSQGKREDIDLAIRNEKEAQDPCIKIVIGTNLLESSLTVVDVQWIVDTGREKRIDLIGNRSHLGECFISKNSADQRKGRTGRTIEGSVCYRMYTEEHYKRLEDYRPLEIRRTPICDVVIELSAIGLDPVKVISELDHDKLRDAKKVLAEIGCIILNEPKEQLGAFDYDLHGKPINPPKGGAVIVTEVGHFVSMMPMDVRNAAALYYYLSGLKEGQWNIEPHFNDVNLFWALASIVIIDLYGPSPLWFIRKNKGERPIEYKMRIDEHKQEFFSEFIQGDPLSSLLIAFKKCLDEGDGLNISFKTMKKWCKDNSCNNKKMRETVVQMKRMQKLLFSLNDECLCEYEKVDEEVLKMMPKLTQCLHRAYSGILLTNHYHSMVAADGRIVQLDTMKTLSTHNIISTNYIPLSEIQIKDAKGRITILISLWLPLDIKPLLVIEPFKIQTISINVDQEESSE